jgi:hypothetical protein
MPNIDEANGNKALNGGESASQPSTTSRNSDAPQRPQLGYRPDGLPKSLGGLSSEEEYKKYLAKHVFGMSLGR